MPSSHRAAFASPSADRMLIGRANGPVARRIARVVTMLLPIGLVVLLCTLSSADEPACDLDSDTEISAEPRVITGKIVGQPVKVAHLLRQPSAQMHSSFTEAERGSCLDDVGNPMSGADASPPDVVVLGGGLAGLAAAHRILVKQPSASVVVLELDESLGGNAMGGFDEKTGELACMIYSAIDMSTAVLPTALCLPFIVAAIYTCSFAKG